MSFSVQVKPPTTVQAGWFVCDNTGRPVSIIRPRPDGGFRVDAVLGTEHLANPNTEDAALFVAGHLPRERSDAATEGPAS